MSLEVTAPAERLATVHTLVRLYSSMSSDVPLKVASVRESLVTSRTLVGLLAGVKAGVCLQVTLVSKRFVANLTLVRFNSSVDAVVSSEVASSGKRFTTSRTGVGSLSGVGSQVDEEVGGGREHLITVLANVVRLIPPNVNHIFVVDLAQRIGVQQYLPHHLIGEFSTQDLGTGVWRDLLESTVTFSCWTRLLVK